MNDEPLRCRLGWHDWRIAVVLDQYGDLIVEAVWECDRCGTAYTGPFPQARFAEF
jgi:hypothetical protein